MTNAMVSTGIDAQGFECFADSATPAQGFKIPAQPVEHCEAKRVNLIHNGEFVKLKADSKSVWIKGAWDHSSRTYELTHTEDINRARYVKTGTVLYVGFTY